MSNFELELDFIGKKAKQQISYSDEEQSDPADLEIANFDWLSEQEKTQPDIYGGRADASEDSEAQEDEDEDGEAANADDDDHLERQQDKT